MGAVRVTCAVVLAVVAGCGLFAPACAVLAQTPTFQVLTPVDGPTVEAGRLARGRVSATDVRATRTRYTVRVPADQSLITKGRTVDLQIVAQSVQATVADVTPRYYADGSTRYLVDVRPGLPVVSDVTLLQPGPFVWASTDPRCVPKAPQ
jgi:hypothetical protein